MLKNGQTYLNVFWCELCKIFNVCLAIFNIIHDTLLPTPNTAELFKYF